MKGQVASMHASDIFEPLSVKIQIILHPQLNCMYDIKNR